MAGKVALITGITGQDGSYLTELLVSKGYTVSYCDPSVMDISGRVGAVGYATSERKADTIMTLCGLLEGNEIVRRCAMSVCVVCWLEQPFRVHRRVGDRHRVSYHAGTGPRLQVAVYFVKCALSIINEGNCGYRNFQYALIFR